MKFQKRQITLLWTKSMLLTRRRAPFLLKKKKKISIISKKLKTQRNVEVEVTDTQME